MVLAVLLPSVLASADPLPGAGGDKVELTADELSVDVQGKSALLSGNVTVTRGDLKVGCPKVEVRYEDGPRLTWAKAWGGVTAEIKGVHAEAPEAELDLGKHQLELRGGVRMTRGQTWLNADSATIELGSARVTLREVRGAMPVAR